MKNKILSIALLAAITGSTEAQVKNNDVYKHTDRFQSEVRNEIRLPKVNGLLPLKCDFHMHTVFSDGQVWPTIRVQEAWQHGLDIISLTDHMEHSPNKQGNINDANRIAQEYAQDKGIIVVKGIEISKSKPLGHLNALFVKDAMKVKNDDGLKAIDEAIKQGAFIEWNHPGWPDLKSTLYPVHQELIKKNKIHGVEVFNYDEHYPVSFDWCNEMNLAYMSNSDVHGLISIDYGIDMKMRPMTIAFSKTKSEKGVREALFSRRTIAYFFGEIAGKEDLIREFVKASVDVVFSNEKHLELYNHTDISYTLKGKTSTYHLKAGKTLRVPLNKEANSYEVVNCHIGMNKVLMIDLEEFL